MVGVLLCMVAVLLCGCCYRVRGTHRNGSGCGCHGRVFRCVLCVLWWPCYRVGVMIRRTIRVLSCGCYYRTRGTHRNVCITNIMGF